MAFRKTYKRKASKKRIYKRKTYRKKTSPLKKMVKQMIARSAETKLLQGPLVNKQLYTADAVNFADNVIPMGPNNVTLALQQGPGQGQRIGNVVNTKKLTFKGSINATPYNVTTNPTPRPLMVQFIFCYDREDPNDAFSPAAGNVFFQNGSSTAGFTNTLTDIWRPINEDRFRVFARKTFKLGFAQYAGTTANTTNQAQHQAYANNDFKLSHIFSFDLTKWYPKVVKFDDNLSIPMTRNVYCFIQYVDALGGSMVAPYEACEVSYCLNYMYEDA